MEYEVTTPWERYANAVNALFAKDGEVDVIYNSDETKLSLMVENPAKADALQQLMPTEKKFGDVTLKIRVVPANLKMTNTQLYLIAFSGNPAFSFVSNVDVGPNVRTYVRFKKEVVQYSDDNPEDPSGLRSTLYQELANEVFESKDDVSFCTESWGPWEEF